MEVAIFEVEIRLRKWQSELLPEGQQGAEVVCRAVVDSGALTLCLAEEVVEQLKLVEVGRVRARLADGSRQEFRSMGVVDLEVQGRQWRGDAVELPRGTAALLGAIPLEAMDWHIAPAEQRLVPNPESPDMPSAPLLRLIYSNTSR